MQDPTTPTIEERETAYALIAAMNAMRHGGRVKPEGVAEAIIGAMGSNVSDIELDRLTDTLVTMVSDLSERADAVLRKHLSGFGQGKPLAVLGSGGDFTREVRS